jgi:hypothetical protein
LNCAVNAECPTFAETIKPAARGSESEQSDGQKRSLTCRVSSRALEEHADAIALGVVFDAGHVRAHEHEAPAAGDFEAFRRGGVGDAVGLEARAAVLNFKGHAPVVDFPLHADGLLGDVFVPVPESVGDGFLEREAQGEDGGGGELVAFNGGEEPLLRLPDRRRQRVMGGVGSWRSGPRGIT